MSSNVEGDAELREILDGTRTIAVVGQKTGPADDAHRVPAYLQARGYRILPVNPIGAPPVFSAAEFAWPESSPRSIDGFVR